MKNILIVIIAVMLLISGCVNEQNPTCATGTLSDSEMITEVFFKEGHNVFIPDETPEFSVESECIPDKESAIQFAGIILRNLQKQGMYTDYIPICVEYDTDDEIWVVTFATDFIPGAGLSIAIRRDNAEVVAMWTGE